LLPILTFVGTYKLLIAGHFCRKVLSSSYGKCSLSLDLNEKHDFSLLFIVSSKRHTAFIFLEVWVPAFYLSMHSTHGQRHGGANLNISNGYVFFIIVCRLSDNSAGGAHINQNLPRKSSVFHQNQAIQKTPNSPAFRLKSLPVFCFPLR
jgi:hypothetical protein